MPWPAHVERPQSPGALVLNHQLTLNVTGDVPGDAVITGASALPARPAGRYNRKWRRLTPTIHVVVAKSAGDSRP